GAVTAADVMGRAIELAAQRKPVVVSMSDVAASGGYWIASKATRVFANRATYTGSIGVVMARPDLEGTYALLGINQEIIKRGKNADLMSTTGPLRPDQIDILTRNVTDIYEEFLDVVSEGRNMDRNAVDSVAQGRVWTGEQALDHNLVDDIGGLREALVAARADAGIEPGQRTALRIFPPTRTIFDELASLFNISAVTLRSSPMPSGPLSLSLGAVWERIRILQIAGPLWAIMDTALPVPAR
ncbi:MAG TPA: S49 family peptidase, partial [Acidobacteriota bacterium]|nr:S49 family peptidase [Acidobacteriota bacterium]